MRPRAITTPTGRLDRLRRGFGASRQSSPVARRGSAEGRPLPESSKVAFESMTELGFKGSQAGVEQFAFRDDDDVEAWRELVATKNLSNQSFSSISLDRAAQFPRGGDSQSAHWQVVREREQRQIAAMRPGAAIVNLLILGAAADTFVRPKGLQRQRGVNAC